MSLIVRNIVILLLYVASRKECNRTFHIQLRPKGYSPSIISICYMESDSGRTFVSQPWQQIKAGKDNLPWEFVSKGNIHADL